jgi:hypothetical protein
VPALPGQVTGLSVGSGVSQLDLVWSVPVSNPALSSYNIYRSTTSGAEVLFDTSFTNSYSDIDVTLGTTYYYKVAAVNAIGTGALSTEASGIPSIPVGPPLAPTGLAVSSITTSFANLNCNTALANPTATSYRFSYSTSPSFSPITTFVSSGTSTGIGPLASGTLYYVRVSAVNSYGEGAFSPTITFNTLVVTPTLLLHLDGDLTDSAGGAVLNTLHQSNGFMTPGKFGSGGLRINYPTDPAAKDYFEVDNAVPGIQIDSYFSLSFWIYPQDLSALSERRFLAGKREDIANKWQIDIDSSGVARFNVRHGGADSVYEVSGFTTGSWQMVTVTQDRVTPTFEIYRNGVIGTVSASPAQGLQEPPAPAFNRLIFGKRADGATYFEGYYDEVQYFKGNKLTATNILNLFNTNAP